MRGGLEPRKSRCSDSTFISPYDFLSPPTNMVAFVDYPIGLGATDLNYLKASAYAWDTLIASSNLANAPSLWIQRTWS